MERRLTEEQITKAILIWLETIGWEILCYDFPQSGTGISLHPNENIRTTKNKGAIIPDIVALKGTVALFFENKDRFVLKDLIKVNDLRTSSDYSASLDKLLKNYTVTNIYFGVGLPNLQNVHQKIHAHQEMIDFAVSVNGDRSTNVSYQAISIFV